jgi:hypothetical protein
MSSASDQGNYEASFLCQIFDKAGDRRELPVALGVKEYQVRQIEFTDFEITESASFKESIDFENRFSVYVDIPSAMPPNAGWNRTRVYDFDFRHLNHRVGSIVISVIVEPRPNVVNSRVIEATGICKMILRKESS